MNRFKNILVYVPSEGSGGALAAGQAFELAHRNQVPVKLLGVLERDPDEDRRAPGAEGMTRLREESLQAELSSLASSPAARGLRVTTSIRTGRPFMQIIQEVLAADHDLVIKAAEGEPGSGGILGSTAFHLLRKCPCPVWIVKPDGQRLRRVVAAVDADPEDEELWAQQQSILQLAHSLASSHDAELSVVHAWDLPRSALEGMSLPSEEIEKARVMAREDARIQVEMLMAKTFPQIPRDKLALVEGDHGPAIAHYLASQESDLVVMGTASRASVPGLFIGNTAELVLQTLDCSVLAVKPAGFVSPVSLPEASSAGS